MESPKESTRPRADVPRYYRVSTKFWDDEKSSHWPESIQRLALYLLTNKHRTLEGIFVLPMNYIAADLRLSVRRVQTGIEVLSKDGFVAFDSDTNLLLIKNALRYQQPESTNVVTGAIRRIKDLPKSPLLMEFLGLAALHCRRKGASASAQSFPVLLQQELGHLFELTSEHESALLTSSLKSQTLTITKTSISNLQPRPVGDGDPECLLPQVETEAERKEAETRKRFPHLAQTAGFESVGQIRHKGKPKSMVNLL